MFTNYTEVIKIPDNWTDEETINNYELGGMPKFYEVK